MDSPRHLGNSIPRPKSSTELGTPLANGKDVVFARGFATATAVAVFGLGCGAQASAPSEVPAPARPSPVRPSAEGAPADGAIAAGLGPVESDEDADPTALDDYRGTLDRHGTWVEDSIYGRVWVPARKEVGADFVPYLTAGHWAYGDEYVWASDYAWGWVPFHHGRWVLTERRGWAWIPGRTYAGAWVLWRAGEDYVGWTATPPAWVWREGTAIRLRVIPASTYVFCPGHELFAPFVSSRIVHDDQLLGVEHRTQPYAAGGPPPSVIGIEPGRVVAALPRDREIYIPRPSTISLGVASPQRRSPAHKTH